jgi:hypothetical protein
MRHRLSQRGGELLARLADEVSPDDAREEVGEAFDAAFLRAPAGDPVDALVAAEGFCRRIGVGGLRVVVARSMPRADTAATAAAAFSAL